MCRSRTIEDGAPRFRIPGVATITADGTDIEVIVIALVFMLCMEVSDHRES